MANLDQPQGFRPFGEVLRQQEYVADAAIYPGDLVEKTAAGKVQVIADGTAGAAVVGVAMSYAAADGDPVVVADHPNQLFVVQSDDATIDEQTDIGLNYDVVATAGNASYKISRMELDGNSGVDTAATPLTLIAIKKSINNALGANVECIVQLNQHVYKSVGTAGV